MECTCIALLEDEQECLTTTKRCVRLAVWQRPPAGHGGKSGPPPAGRGGDTGLYPAGAWRRLKIVPFTLSGCYELVDMRNRLRTIEQHLPEGGRVALLVWGDPSLYDSTLRIARRLATHTELTTTVVPGITALQALTAAHAIPLNDINAPVLITTGRQLRERGWPDSADTVAVMLDGQCAFQTLDPQGLHIWWGAFLGMPHQLCLSGPLAEAGPAILREREQARARHGWIMDTYLLRRTPDNGTPHGH